jgi:hypothetical protein
MPSTWKAWVNEYSKDHKLSMDYEMDQWKQDLIATWKIQKWMNQWYRPDQIASLWNHGKPEYDWVVWVNKHWVAYNTPRYVNDVMKLLWVNVSSGWNTMTKAKLDTISARSWISVIDLKKMTNDQVNSINGNMEDKVFRWIRALPFSNPDLESAALSILMWEIDPKAAYDLIVKYYPEYKDQLDKSMWLWGWTSVLSNINGQ